MVRMYKAGAAYVEVVPVFKDFQRLVSKHLKESLGNEKAFKDLENNLQKSVNSGLDNISDKIKSELKDEGLVIESKKTGTKIAKGVNKGAADEFRRDDALAREVRNFGKRMGDALGDKFMIGATQSKEARVEIIDNLQRLSKAYTKEGDKSASEVEKTYERIRRAMEGVVKGGSGKGKASSLDIGLLEDVLTSFEKNHLRIAKGMSKAQIQLDKETTAAAIAEAKARKTARDKEIKDAEKAQKDALAAEEKARKDREVAAEKARKAEEVAAEKARKAEEVAAERARKAEEDAQIKAEKARAKEEEDREKLQIAITKIHIRALRENEIYNQRIEKQERDHQLQLERDSQNASDRQRRRNEIERARQATADAIERARQRASSSYDDIHSTARSRWREVGAEDARGNAKQQRLAAGRAKTIRAARDEVNKLLSAMSQLGRANPTVKLNTTQAVSRIRDLQRDIGQAFYRLNEAQNIDVDTTEARLALQQLRIASESFDSIDWDVDLNDEEAQASLLALKAELEGLGDADIDVHVDYERAALAETVARIKSHLDSVKNVEVEVDEKDALVDIGAINLALDTLRDKKVGVDIEEKDALAAIAVINTSLASLDENDVNIDIDRDGSFSRGLRNLDSGLKDASARTRILSNRIASAGISMMETTQAFRVFNPMVAGLAFAAAPAVSAIGGLTAGLGGLVSMAPGLVAGMGTMVAAFGGLDDAMKKYEKAQEALKIPKKDLTEAQKEAIKTWEAESKVLGEATTKWIEFSDTLKTEVAAIQKGAREGLFPGLQSSIETLLGEYAGPLTDFLERMGKGLGFIAEQWANDLTGPQAQSWFARVADDAVLYTLNMADAGSNLVSGFAGLVDAFRPFAQEFSQYLIDATGRFDDWANALGGNAKFNRFLNTVRETAPMFGDLLKNIGEFFVNATIAVEPFTTAIMDALNGALDFVNALDPRVLGAILGAIGGLTGGIMILSGVVAGAGALAAVMTAAFSTPFTAAVTGIGAFVAISTTALGVSSALESVSGDLGSVMGSLGGALEHAADFARGLWGAFGNLLEAVAPLGAPLAEVLGDLVDLGALLGSGLITGLNGLAGVVGGIVDVFTALPDWLQETSIMFALVGGAGLAVGKNMDTVRAAFGLVVDSITSFGRNAGKAAGDLWLFFSNIGEGTANITGMGAAAKSADGNVSLLKSGLLGLGITTGVLAGVTAGIWLLSEAQERSKKLAEDGKKALESYAEGAVEYGGGVRKGLEEVFDAEWWEGTAGTMEEQLERLANMQKTGEYAGTKVLKQNMQELDEVLAKMVEDGNVDQAIVSWQEFADQAKASGADVEAMTNDYFPGFIDSLKNINAELGGVVSEQELMSAISEGRLPESLLLAMESSDKYKGSVAGVKSELNKAEQATKDLIAANDELSGRFLNQEEANNAYYEAMDKFNAYVKTAKGGIDAQTEAGRKNREEIGKMAEAVKSKADADLAASGDVDQYTNTLWSQRKALIEAAKKMGATEEEAGELANTVLEIPKEVDTKAELQDYASKKAQDIKDELKGIKDKSIAVRITKDDPFGLWNEGKGPKANSSNTPGPWKDGYNFGYHGNLLEFYAQGGLRNMGALSPMDPIAQMVQPNTWRVVGDRGDVPEAYIPLNGSSRSWEIMLEALRMMPGALPFYDGGIAAFANGAVAMPGGAPQAPGAEGGDPTQVSDLSAVTAAFQELAASLGTSWDSLLTSMLERFNLFTVDTTTSAIAFQTGITEQTIAFHEQSKGSHSAYLSALTAAYAAFRASEAGAFSAFLTRESERDSAHKAAMRDRRAAFNGHELDALDSFLASSASRNRSGGDSIRNRWDDTWGWMSDDSASFRRAEADRLDAFLNGTLMSTVGRFGNSISSEWGKIWNGLVDSAARIFRALPDEIGSILSSTGGRINKHIVNPYNKIVSDLDLKKELKIGQFPTQKYRDGGMMQGYTPGRDVHTFFSDTGGVLELSGGEPVLRPEVGAVVGSEWVDGINGAARSKGITGVKQFLGMGHQAHAEGGFIESFANGGRIKKDRKGIIELGHVLQGLGVKVSEHSAFGGNSGGHSRNSWHNRDGALDLNTAPGTSAKEMADFDRIMPMLYKLGWGTIWRYPNHYGHAHVDIGNRSLGSFNRNPKTSGDLWERLLSMKVGPATGGGTSTDFYDIKGEMAGWIKKAQSAVGEGAIPEMFMGASSKLFTELADAKSDQFIETASMGVGMPGNYKPGSGVKRWRPEILEALEMTGNSTSDAMVNIVMRRMSQESGGNPKAINNWDINARRGMASRGLMQVIPPTFQQWRSRSLTNDIWDPLANIVASMRYAKGTYGSLPAAYNKKGGYAEGTSGIELPPVAAPPALDLSPDAIFRDGGGPLPTGYTTVLNNLGHEETILPKTPHEVTKTFEKMVETNTGEGGPKFYDSKFMSDAKETAEEIHRMGRMSRAATPVRM